MSILMPYTNASNPYVDAITNSYGVYVTTQLSKKDKIHVSVLGCDHLAVVLVPVPADRTYKDMEEEIGASTEPYFEGINNDLKRVNMPTLDESYKDVIIIWEVDPSLGLDRSFELFHAKGNRTFTVSELCEGQDNIRINIGELVHGIRPTPYKL